MTARTLLTALVLLTTIAMVFSIAQQRNNNVNVMKGRIKPPPVVEVIKLPRRTLAPQQKSVQLLSKKTNNKKDEKDEEINDEEEQEQTDPPEAGVDTVPTIGKNLNIFRFPKKPEKNP
ncbi:hypothetical protein B566_EDAN016510 [Ephemera danica]|nr:hypothetical protein B566_EDAN016510 [Ephemera danica]